jgi:hypothetical protein
MLNEHGKQQFLQDWRICIKKSSSLPK